MQAWAVGFSFDSLLHVWKQEQLCIDPLRNYLKDTWAQNWKKNHTGF